MHTRQTPSPEGRQAAPTRPDPLSITFRAGVFPATSETFVASQVAGMKARGHTVRVLADTLDARAPSDVWAGLEEARAISPRRPIVAHVYERLPDRIRRRVRAERERACAATSDVVVCNFGWFGQSVAQATRGRPRRAKLLTIFHGADISRSVTSDDVYSDLFATGDLFLAVSEFWRRRLLELGAPAERTRVFRMGVDLDELPFAPRLAQGPVLRLLAVGRLVEKKGTAILLDALARARALAGDGMRDLHLTIIGDGPLDADLRARTRALGLDGSVEFLGARPHDAVRRALAEADAFALPSVTGADGDMEGIPVALMEAMAAGRPVISTRHSGIPELIAHGEEGLLTDERDPEGLADALLRVAAGGPDIRTMVDRARRKIERDFDRRLLNAELDTILRGLVRPSPNRLETSPQR